MVASATAEATWARVNYPYEVVNGMFSQERDRSNSDIRAFQGELNLVNRFADSSVLQTKIWGYYSERGLPGSIIYFNDISEQRLEDKDFFVQSRYLKKFNAATSLLISAKYSSMYTKYTDPNFLIMLAAWMTDILRMKFMVALRSVNGPEIIFLFRWLPTLLILICQLISIPFQLLHEPASGPFL